MPLLRKTLLLLVVLSAALAAPAGAQAAGLTASFSTSSDWGSGFVGAYTITNGGTSPVVGWRLEFDLPLNESITGAWSGQLSSLGGHYVVTNASWNQTIAPGTSVNPGFQGAYTGTFTPPQNCLINGQPCAGGPPPPPPPPPPPDTTPPSAPTGLSAGTPTTSSVPLSWDASTDNVAVTGYRVYSGSTQVATTTGTAATITGLSPSTPYTFTVRATDAAGNVSAASTPVTVTTAAAPTGGLTATFSKASDWGSGFVGAYTITNGGSSAVNGWRLEFDLPAGASVVNAWNGALTANGSHYVLTDLAWTHTIAPAASVQLGFQVAYNAPPGTPQNCLINGQSCGGGGPPPPPPPDTTPPSAPTGLSAGTPTTSSVPLSWNASTDNVGVTGYRIYNGTTQVATASGTSTIVTGLSPATSYTFTVKAVDAAGNLSAASNTVTVTTAAASGGGGGSNATAPEFAPYVDMTLYPQFSLGQAARTAQIKHFTLAFIVSGGGCKGAWGGVTAIGDPWITSSLADLKAAGGDAIVSFGGEAGQELAAVCSSVDALTAQYQAVIDQYGIRDFDFDIEGAAVADAASIDRRSKALAALQAAGKAAGKPVHVSLTLPVMPTGLTQDGLNVIRSAIANGVEVGQVNVMAMDYFDPSLNYSGHMGDLAIQAAQSTHDQLASLYPGKTDAQLWAMVGVTPMIGINDDNHEVFTTADAAKLVAFANSKALGRLAFWSANRDAPCPSPTQWTSNTCSGVSDPAWAFSQAFEGFPSAPAAPPGPTIAVSGKQLVNGSGTPLRVAGVNRSGSEYACAQGWGLFDGPTDDASILAMTAWGINAVRVPLNEDCWLGVNGVKAAYAGANYQAAIRAYVDRLRAHGLDVILDLHWGAPGTQLALGQEQAPDADHAPAFWSSVASAYKGVSGVAFDLFNEPHDISWACWLNGCTTSGGWPAAGEQQLINAVRGAGATQPVIADGLNWGGDLSGWLANQPHDPAGQLVAGWHVYNFSGCATTTCWDSTVAPVAQQLPVLATEIGESDCGGGFLNTLLPWADSHQIGYLAWAWNAASCGGGPSLISDYSGTPTGYGSAFKSYLSAHASGR